jgi:hypothetical protein
MNSLCRTGEVILFIVLLSKDSILFIINHLIINCDDVMNKAYH